MKIVPVSKLLNDAGYTEPVLNALIPNEHNYSVLLMQPRGQIEANASGVHNRDQNLAHEQFSQFLRNAFANQADLVITPEYSMPWKVLVTSLKSGIIPNEGKIWAIGCESITYPELEKIKQDIAPNATFLFENLPHVPDRQTDPLAYVFLAKPNDSDAPKVVILVQFKTCTMGADCDHFEINQLQLGTLIYQFGSVPSSLRLISLICSDAFDFSEQNHAKDIYVNTLIIHVQLNPNPRQATYRKYRDQLFGYAGDTTEVICLNWAHSVEEWGTNGKNDWQNIAGSAWYLRPNRFDIKDTTLCSNHQRGLYYTWFQNTKTHALFFNYQEAVFRITTSKVAHVGVLDLKSQRRGPQLTNVLIWDENNNMWKEQDTAEDGFTALSEQSGPAKEELRCIAKRNPIEVERVIALCVGDICHQGDWYSVQRLESFGINATEVINRLTFCQDNHQLAYEYRTARVIKCGHLWRILKTNNQLPPSLAEFGDGFSLGWDPDCPHQNAISSAGKRATVIYLGEDKSYDQVERVFTQTAALLQRGFTDANESHGARQRLAVWYRDIDGEIKQYARGHFVNYSNPGDTNEYDIAKES
ncbi:MAG: hypothetical protein WCP45_05985 [Verrucomicrobiota bacterium]